MGRRSFISMTAINRIISASNSRKREQERINLINSQSGTEKELPPTYSLINFVFNIDSRIAKLEIEQKQQYRTVERYVTQNYVRYPIYSNWKTRTKLIKKTIKLTNQQLETLNDYDDDLIIQFADEIVIALNNEELMPSWFIKSFLAKEYRDDIQKLDNEKNIFRAETSKRQEQNKKIIEQNKTDIQNTTLILRKKEKQESKLNLKIQKIKNAKKSFILSLCTLFIYNYTKSNYRKKKLTAKQTKLQACINTLQNALNQKNESNIVFKKENEELEQSYVNKKNEIEALKNERTKLFRTKSHQVQPLPFTCSNSDSFIPLKSFCGLEYEKIIGCYVIHNSVNDKYYVGQSKDIIKRLRQHFKGTVPNNIIFAEDYYSTPQENRNNLFEVKIIPCQTKDELDRTEKQLIENYDAFNSGYNGTNGNT